MRCITDYRPEGGDWTRAFEQAIADLRETGGVLTVPAGRYVTGPLQLYSDIELHLEAGARIEFVTDEAHDKLIDAQFEGIPGRCHMPLLYAKDAERVRLTGHGTLVGNGELWWDRLRNGTLDLPRPMFVWLENCRDVLIENLTFLDSPCWTLHPLRCDGVTIRGLKIRNPYDAPNTDGMDPESCRNVRISDCEIDVGDDCIVLKSGTEDTPDHRPCENVLITGCLMIHGHGAVVIGSEMSGGVRNVRVADCVFRDTDRGIRLKTRRARGGMVENVLVSGIVMDGVMCPAVVNMYYLCGKDGDLQRVWDKRPYPVDSGTPVIRSLHFSNIRAVNATACAAFLYGLPESPIEDVTLSDFTVAMKRGCPGEPAMLRDVGEWEARGMFLRNIRGLNLRDFRVLNADGDAIDADGSVEFV